MLIVEGSQGYMSINFFLFLLKRPTSLPQVEKCGKIEKPTLGFFETIYSPGGRRERGNPSCSKYRCLTILVSHTHAHIIWMSRGTTSYTCAPGSFTPLITLTTYTNIHSRRNTKLCCYVSRRSSVSLCTYFADAAVSNAARDWAPSKHPKPPIWNSEKCALWFQPNTFQSYSLCIFSVPYFKA